MQTNIIIFWRYANVMQKIINFWENYIAKLIYMVYNLVVVTKKHFFIDEN